MGATVVVVAGATVVVVAGATVVVVVTLRPSAETVSGVSVDVTVRPFDFWKKEIASAVLEPKTPSVPPRTVTPAATRALCTVSTDFPFPPRFGITARSTAAGAAVVVVAGATVVVVTGAIASFKTATVASSTTPVTRSPTTF